MFEKFFRVDTPEHKKVTGTGIGMYVTKQYIEAMNGKTWFTSNPRRRHSILFQFAYRKNRHLK
jgi:signal transduction histidine kinase